MRSWKLLPRRANVRGFVGLVLLLITVFGAADWMQRSRNLADISIQVHTFDAGVLMGDSFYLWQTDDTALVLTHRSEWQASSVRIGSDKQQENLKLEGLINGNRSRPRFPYGSTDGKWIAWYTNGDFTAVATDGSHAFIPPVKTDCISTWTVDKKWLAQILVHEHQGSNDASGITFTSLISPRTVETVAMQTGVIPFENLIALLSDKQILTAGRFQLGTQPSIDLRDLPSGGSRLNTFHYNLPPLAIVRSLEVSPDGHHICWLLRSAGEASCVEWFKKRAHLIDNGDQQTWLLWVTSVDGKDGHEIGYLKAPPSDPSPIREIKWTPSSRYIGYRRNGVLWRVPVTR